jgi:hypothetical protein
LVKLASIPPPYAISVNPGACLKETRFLSNVFALLRSAGLFWGIPWGENPSSGPGKKAAHLGVTVPNAFKTRVVHSFGRLASGSVHSALAHRPMSSDFRALGSIQSASQGGSW